MMCGFKTPTKLSPLKIQPKLSPTKLQYESGKGQERSPKAGYSDTSVETLSPSRVAIINEGRPVNNKENLLRRLSAVETNDLECSPLQDSGYSSVLVNDSQSQDEEDFSTSITSIPILETPKQQTSQEQIVSAFQSTIRLPMLRFGEVVCSTLKKNCKRSPKVDWDTIEEVVSSEDFGLDKLIGRKMGLERMDILKELFHRDFKHLLGKIFRHLSAADLINVVMVSTTWRKILQNDSWAYSRYKQRPRDIYDSAVRKTEHTATRDASLCRIPLSSVQKIASAACCVSKKKSNKKKKASSYSRYSEFSEVGKTLTNDQCLKVCRDCGSPAKYDSYQNRAVCTRESCQLDFCTLCNCQYHFSKDCATSKAQNYRYLSEPLAGSKKSKQNLRRL